MELTLCVCRMQYLQKSCGCSIVNFCQICSTETATISEMAVSLEEKAHQAVTPSLTLAPSWWNHQDPERIYGMAWFHRLLPRPFNLYFTFSAGVWEPDMNTKGFSLPLWMIKWLTRHSERCHVTIPVRCQLNNAQKAWLIGSLVLNWLRVLDVLTGRFLNYNSSCVPCQTSGSFQAAFIWILLCFTSPHLTSPAPQQLFWCISTVAVMCCHIFSYGFWWLSSSQIKLVSVCNFTFLGWF